MSTPLLTRVDASTLPRAEEGRWHAYTLRDLASTLLAHNGARTLADDWRPGSTMGANAGDKYLLKAAEDHAVFAATVSRHAARATLLRYHLAGLVPVRGVHPLST